MSAKQHVAALEPRLLFSATPSNDEQYLLELINAARANPSAALTHLLNSPDTSLKGELTYFGVNRTVLAQQFASLTPQPPLAWNANLASVAEAHNQLMISHRSQENMYPGEDNLGQRTISSGYAPIDQLLNVNGLLYGYAHSPVEAAASFLINWEYGAPNGISGTTTFRDALLSPADREIGLSYQPVPAGSPSFGPNSVNINVASRAGASPVLLGVAYNDNVLHDSFYTPGEGLAGLTVTATRDADNATFTTTTTSSGGYTLPLEPGTYSVTLSGAGLSTPFSQTGVVISDQNVQLDAPTYTPPPASPADLAVTVSKPPASVAPGAKIPLTVTLTNKGPAFSGPVDVTVYFSTDKTIDPSDRALPTVTVPLSIAANKTKTYPVDAGPLAKLLPSGNYYILVRINPAGDTNAANNTAASPSAAKITAASTNPVPTLPSRPLAPNKKKNTLPFTLSIKNTGTVPAVGTASLAVSLRPTDGGPDIPLPPITSVPLNIKPKAALSLPKSLSLAGISPGTYKLVLTLSATLSTPESDPSDNTTLSAPFTIK